MYYFLDRRGHILEDGYGVPASAQEHQRVVQPDLRSTRGNSPADIPCSKSAGDSLV